MSFYVCVCMCVCVYDTYLAVLRYLPENLYLLIFQTYVATNHCLTLLTL